MRTLTYLQPGERRGCVGCHERSGSAFRRGWPWRSPAGHRPSRPGPDGSSPLSYPRLVQPVLDRHCVRCHDGAEEKAKSPLLLTGEPSGEFTRSYESLRPFVRWYEWGAKSIHQTVTIPGRMGAEESPLSALIADKTHGPAIELPDADRRRSTCGSTPTGRFTEPIPKKNDWRSSKARPCRCRSYSKSSANANDSSTMRRQRGFAFGVRRLIAAFPRTVIRSTRSGANRSDSGKRASPRGYQSMARQACEGQIASG